MWNPFKALFRVFKGAFDMQIYLVVIDSTKASRNVNETMSDGTMNVRNFTLSNGIQNFYLILAPNPDVAKKMVLNTFRSKPRIMSDASRCITATPLDAITKLLKGNQNTWSYIPIGGIRAPGQQGVNNTLQQLEDMRRLGANQEISHTNWQPPNPITYDGQEVHSADIKKSDLGNLSPEEAAIINGNSGSNPGAPLPNPGNMDLAQMQAMMSQMQAMMNNMGSGHNSPINENSADSQLNVRRVDPKFDPELQERIAANINSGLEYAPEYDSTGSEISPDLDAEI